MNIFDNIRRIGQKVYHIIRLIFRYFVLFQKGIIQFPVNPFSY